MTRVVFIAFIIVITSCTDKISTADLQHLNGYWEIKKVEFPDGDSREYSLSTTIDFISLEGTTGFRKKMQPNLDGSFITSDDAEHFEILSSKGRIKMRYKNSLSQWEEQIEKISSDNFIVVNEENIRYYYKRFQAILQEE